MQRRLQVRRIDSYSYVDAYRDVHAHRNTDSPSHRSVYRSKPVRRFVYDFERWLRGLYRQRDVHVLSLHPHLQHHFGT